jgi:P27 family predicted phage terminase small subunit
LRSGLLAQLDRNSLARYCSNLALWKSCVQLVAQEGTTSAEFAGDKESPHVALMLKLDDKLTKAEDRYGLNPTARASIGNVLMKDDEKPNTKARFFA